MSLKDHGVNLSIVPSGGGWRYEQPFKDGIQRIPPRGDAGSADRLVEQVKTFRAHAHIDMGDPELDIAIYIKKNSPINNRFPNKRDKEAPRVKSRPIIERIRDNLLTLGSRTPKLVILDDAEQRASVCSECPQNIKWMTGCVPCCEEIKSRGQNLRQAASAPTDGLGACRLHDFYLPAVTFVDRDELADAHPDAPAFCWMKVERIHNFDSIEVGDVIEVTNHGNGFTVDINCPGCGRKHQLPVKGLPNPYVGNKPWGWNFSKKNPTLTPSVSSRSGPEDARTICHFNLDDGVMTFHKDSTHELSGTKQPLAPIK